MLQSMHARDRHDVSEGYVPFRGHRTWYRIITPAGGARRSPVLILHGGPGVPHDYLEPLAGLADLGHPVVFYDQLGCGNSDRPDDPALWTVELFLDELRTVRAALELAPVHLLGHSWGGMLAMEYALLRPAGLLGIVISNSPGSMPDWSAETARLRDALPQATRATLIAHERAGTTDSAAYQAAVSEFYARHLCRLDPMPGPVLRTFEKLGAWPQVYHVMNGPSEFTVVGRLRDWSILERLHGINVPALVLGGRHDEATPALCAAITERIPGARAVTFEDSSHMPFHEESAAYLQAVGLFLEGIEGRGRA